MSAMVIELILIILRLSGCTWILSPKETFSLNGALFDQSCLPDVDLPEGDVTEMVVDGHAQGAFHDVVAHDVSIEIFIDLLRRGWNPGGDSLGHFPSNCLDFHAHLEIT